MTQTEWKKLKIGDYILLISYNEIFIIKSQKQNIKNPEFVYEYVITKPNNPKYKGTAYIPKCWKLLTQQDKIKLL